MNQYILYHTTRFLATSSRGMLAVPAGASARATLASVHCHGAYPNRMRLTDSLLGVPELEETLTSILLGPDALDHLHREHWRPRSHSVLLGVDLQDAERFQTPDSFQQWKDEGASFTNGTLTLPAFASVAQMKDKAETAACFAKASQLAGLVPMVSVEIEGSRSNRTRPTVEEALEHLFEACRLQGVYFPGMLLRVPVPDLNSFEYREVPSIPDRLGGILLHQDDTPTAEFRKVLACIAENAPPMPWPVTYCLGEQFVRETLADWQGLEPPVPTAGEGGTRLVAVRESFSGTPDNNTLANA